LKAEVLKEAEKTDDRFIRLMSVHDLFALHHRLCGIMNALRSSAVGVGIDLPVPIVNGKKRKTEEEDDKDADKENATDAKADATDVPLTQPDPVSAAPSTAKKEPPMSILEVVVAPLDRKTRHETLFAHALLSFDRIEEVCKLLEVDVIDARWKDKHPNGWAIPDDSELARLSQGLYLLQSLKGIRRALEEIRRN